MEAFDLAELERVSPWDAMLLVVNRRAARVRWTDAVVQALLDAHVKRCAAALADDPTADVNPDVPPDEVRHWMQESRKEEQLLTRAAKTAVDAGVADAMVRRMERDGRMVTDVLLAGLDVLELTPEQRMLALSTMHAKLTPVPVLGSGVSGSPIGLPGYAHEAEIVEDDDEPDVHGDI